MRVVVSCIMAVLLLLQAVTGICCACKCDCPHAASSIANPQPTHACCHCRNEQSKHVPAHVPCKGSHCLGVCTYVQSSKVQIENVWHCAAIDSPDVSAISLQLLTLHSNRCDELLVNVAEPPLRLHLLHQIILI
jgi:hypothetical protein